RARRSSSRPRAERGSGRERAELAVAPIAPANAFRMRIARRSDAEALARLVDRKLEQVFHRLRNEPCRFSPAGVCTRTITSPAEARVQLAADGPEESDERHSGVSELADREP